MTIKIKIKKDVLKAILAFCANPKETRRPFLQYLQISRHDGNLILGATDAISVVIYKLGGDEVLENETDDTNTYAIHHGDFTPFLKMKSDYITITIFNENEYSIYCDNFVINNSFVGVKCPDLQRLIPKPANNDLQNVYHVCTISEVVVKKIDAAHQVNRGLKPKKAKNVVVLPQYPVTFQQIYSSEIEGKDFNEIVKALKIERLYTCFGNWTFIAMPIF